jgi:hypothetical protein
MLLHGLPFSWLLSAPLLMANRHLLGCWLLLCVTAAASEDAALQPRSVASPTLASTPPAVLEVQSPLPLLTSSVESSAALPAPEPMSSAADSSAT